MRTHLKILGILYLLSSAVFLLVAFLVATALTGGAVLSGDLGMFAFLSGLGIFLAIFFLILGAPGLIEGYGLLRRRSWARPVGFVLGFLNLFNFPFGTLLGAYTFWVLFQDETERLLS